MDQIANMIVIIKNGYLANKKQVVLQHSKFRFQIAKVLSGAGFVGDVTKDGRNMTIELIYTEGDKPRITQIKKISKQGLRTYIRSKNIKPIKGGRGITVVSTSKGAMTGDEAIKKNLGGEVICQVW